MQWPWFAEESGGLRRIVPRVGQVFDEMRNCSSARDGYRPWEETC